MAIELVKANSSDEERVMQFLIENYYPEDPVDSAAGRRPKSRNDCPAIQFIHQNLSFIAVDTENPNEICAVSLNQEERLCKESDVWSQVKEESSTPYGKVVRFLSQNKQQFLEKIGEMWPEAKGERAFDICVLSVRNANKRQGLANQLVEKSLQLAREKNFKYATIECSSAYSAMLAERHDFVRVHEILYRDYKDEKGEVVFNIPSPHFAFVGYVKKL